MGNKDNWYLLDTIQIPSIFAFNISDVQVFNIFKTYSTYSTYLTYFTFKYVFYELIILF